MSTRNMRTFQPRSLRRYWMQLPSAGPRMPTMSLNPFKRNPLDIPEIVDRVIGHLASDGDVRDLKSCALISKLWLPASRFHRFRDTKIDGPKHLSRLFWCLLRGHPGLGAYIRSLEVTNLGKAPGGNEQMTTTNVEWANLPLLMKLAAMLPALTRLRLHCTLLGSSSTDYPKLASVRELDMDNCLFNCVETMLCFLQAFPVLNRLLLYDAGVPPFGPRPDPAPLVQSYEIKLDRLVLDGPFPPEIPSLDVLVDVFDEHSPSALLVCLRHDPHPAANLGKLLHFCNWAAPRVREIGFMVVDPEALFGNFYRLSFLHAHTLVAGVHSEYLPDPDLTSITVGFLFGGLFELLHTPALEKIQYDLQALFEEPCSTDDTQKVEWCVACDNLRDNLGTFQPQPTVQVKLQAGQERWADVQEMMKALRPLEDQGALQYVFVS